MTWHSTAWPLVLAPMYRSTIAAWPYFSPSSPMTTQVISKYRSSTEQSVPVCSPRPVGGRKEGRKSMRGGRNNSAAAVAYPPLQCTHRQTHEYNNTNVHAVVHPHSTLIMIHTKPHKHLRTSAQEPQPNTNTEHKHIVESLSFSPCPDCFCVVKPASAASQFYFVFFIPPFKTRLKTK